MHLEGGAVARHWIDMSGSYQWMCTTGRDGLYIMTHEKQDDIHERMLMGLTELLLLCVPTSNTAPTLLQNRWLVHALSHL